MSLEKRARRLVASRVHRYLAVVQPALREALGRELRRHGFAAAAENEAGYEFEGRLEECWRAHLLLRTPTRVYLRLAGFKASAIEELFRKTTSLPWDVLLAPGAAVEVDAVVRDSRIRHEGRAAKAVEDAIARSFGRPTRAVETQKILVRIEADRAVLSLDASGRGLYERGYRSERSAAPLRETTAAALLELADWRGERPLYDGMTGSGTLAIEAALSAVPRPPLRPFAFQGWPSFRPAAWAHLVRTFATPAAGSYAEPFVTACDADEAAMGQARRNARAAGCHEIIGFRCADFLAVRPPPGAVAGLLVLNPPYGRRLEAVPSLYRDIGRRMAARWKGWSALVLAPGPEHRAALGLPVARELPLRHGGLRINALFIEKIV